VHYRKSEKIATALGYTKKEKNNTETSKYA
jgi:hypothetical protein